MEIEEKQLAEIKAFIADQAKDVNKAVADVTKANTDLDGVIKQIGSDMEKHGGALTEHKESFVAQQKQVAKCEETLTSVVAKMSTMPTGPDAIKSIGEKAGESEAAKSYTGGDHVTLIEHAGPLVSKIDSTIASAGTLVEAHRVPGIAVAPDRPLTVRDMLTVLSTSSNAIEWVKELLFTNAAAPQAAEGDAKAESNITFEKQSSSVETLAHWMPASRQILADAPALRSFIDQRLIYGLKLHEETQLLSGDGANGNLNGLIPNSTAYDVALNKPGDTIIDQLRRAILQVNKSGYPTTGIVLNPEDWCEIELFKTDDNAYLFSNPTAIAEPRLWGKRVAESLSLAPGTFLSGAFGQAATLWDREQVTIRVSEHHENFFIRNMVAILCEERVCLTVERPAGIVNGALAPTP